MNTSPVLLLLTLLSTCHGEEEIDSNASNFSATMKGQKKVEAPLEASCPDPTDIEPCECLQSNDQQLKMYCHNIEDEQQLWQVFSAYFPTTAFDLFFIQGNTGLKVLENGVFHDVSFQGIYIWESSLQVVEDEALDPSLSTLIKIDIHACQLATFPFERLPEFTSLKHLSLYNNHISSIPPLTSSTLQSLTLNDNPISYLPSDVFKGLPAIHWIYLFSCQLTEITPGAFKDLADLNELHLQYNKLSYLQSHTFDMGSKDNSGLIKLEGNNIDFVEADAFQGVQEISKIHMANNALTRLPETVWRPVLEKGITVTFGGNLLTCGCDVAWLVRNPQLLTGAQDGRCADGKVLTDLDPADFSMCGYVS